MESREIRGPIVLPARRESIELRTDDGLTLVGELALPEAGAPTATLVTFHPLPTAGGFMDSHIIRKAAARLPALAGIAVLRFNLRGVSSPRGTSEGEFDSCRAERHDVRAAFDFVRERGLPDPWALGWSFGTDLVLKYTVDEPFVGAILLSPPLRFTTDDELRRWADEERPVVAFIPEFDDYLRPEAARERFAIAPAIELRPIAGGKHLWVGEAQTRTILNGIAELMTGRADPLPTEWTGPLGEEPR